jgi:hypothetical protein
MWNELFITYNEPSLFCELLTNYTKGVERLIIRILKIKETTASTINIKNQIPMFVLADGSFYTDIIQIGKFICNLTGNFDVLIGRTPEEIKCHEIFIKDFNNAKCKLEFLEKVLSYNSFCNGYHITLSDLYAFAHVLVSIQHFHDEEKRKYSNLIRWVIHIQSLKGITEQISRLKLIMNAPSEKLLLDFASVPVNKDKKEKKEKDKGDPEKFKAMKEAADAKKNEKQVENKKTENKDNKETKEKRKSIK